MSDPVAYQQLKDGKWVGCSAFVAKGFGDEMLEGCRALYLDSNEAKIEALVKAITKARDELAGMLTVPGEPRLEDWPVNGRGDQECLQIAYHALSDALNDASAIPSQSRNTQGGE